MRAYIIIITLFLTTLPTSYAETVQYEVENAVYRVGVHIKGDIAKHLWTSVLKEQKSVTDKGGDGDSHHLVEHKRRNNLIECNKILYVLNRRVNYFCKLFAPNLETNSDPAQVVMSLNNFLYTNNSITFNAIEKKVPRDTLSYTATDITQILGTFIEGDFAKVLFDEYMKEITPRSPIKYENARRVIKQKNRVTCTEFTRANIGKPVHTEFNCYLMGTTNVRAISGGKTLVIDIKNNDLTIKP